MTLIAATDIDRNKSYHVFNPTDLTGNALDSKQPHLAFFYPEEPSKIMTQLNVSGARILELQLTNGLDMIAYEYTGRNDFLFIGKEEGKDYTKLLENRNELIRAVQQQAKAHVAYLDSLAPKVRR